MGFSVGREGKIPDFHEQQPASKEGVTSPLKATQKTEIESGVAKGASNVEPGPVGGSDYIKLRESAEKGSKRFIAHVFSDAPLDTLHIEGASLESKKNIMGAFLRSVGNQKPN